MTTESDLQARIINYLRKKGCYVIKTKPGVGVPIGCPDIIALCGGLWIGIEVKATENSKYQPLQKETIKQLHDWSWCKRVDSSNWHDVRTELEMML